MLNTLASGINSIKTPGRTHKRMHIVRQKRVEMKSEYDEGKEGQREINSTSGRKSKKESVIRAIRLRLCRVSVNESPIDGSNFFFGELYFG